MSMKLVEIIKLEIQFECTHAFSCVCKGIGRFKFRYFKYTKLPN